MLVSKVFSWSSIVYFIDVGFEFFVYGRQLLHYQNCWAWVIFLYITNINEKATKWLFCVISEYNLELHGVWSFTWYLTCQGRSAASEEQLRHTVRRTDTQTLRKFIYIWNHEKKKSLLHHMGYIGLYETYCHTVRKYDFNCLAPRLQYWALYYRRFFSFLQP